jgi:hypothetical protein
MPAWPDSRSRAAFASSDNCECSRRPGSAVVHVAKIVASRANCDRSPDL